LNFSIKQILFLIFSTCCNNGFFISSFSSFSKILFSSSLTAFCIDGVPVTVSNISVVSSFACCSSVSKTPNQWIDLNKKIQDLIKPFVNQKFASLNGFGLNNDFEFTFSFSSSTLVYKDENSNSYREDFYLLEVFLMNL